MKIKVENPGTSLKLLKTPASRIPETKTCQHHARIQNLLQLQIDLLATQSQIKWVELVYQNPQISNQRQVLEASQTSFPGSKETQTYLQTEQWLGNYTRALTLKRVVAKSIEPGFYCCQFGEQSQPNQYLLLFVKGSLSHACRQLIKRIAASISEYLGEHRQNEQQHQKIEILEDIVQRVGHQLRHPLGLINLYAHNLNCILPQGKEQEQASVICKTVNSLNQSLTEILQCASSEKLQIAPRDLRSLVLKTLEDFDSWITEKQLQIHCSGDTTVLTLDSLQIKQAFSNLLSNAIHFSPQGAKIFIDWQKQQDDVVLTFIDEGPGLSSADIQKLFKPFYTRRAGGTGLGLAIAKKIVLDHGGKLWAKNASNKGAEFVISLPRFGSPINLQEENTAC